MQSTGKILMCFFMAVLCCACGTETELFVWRNIDAEQFLPGSESPLDSLERVNALNYEIRVNLTPELYDTYRSSPVTNSYKNARLNDYIDSVRIFSLYDFNEIFSADTILNPFFLAENPDIEGSLDSLVDLVRTIGRTENRLDEGFRIYLTEAPTESDTQRFVVQLFMNGDTRTPTIADTLNPVIFD